MPARCPTSGTGAARLEVRVLVEVPGRFLGMLGDVSSKSFVPDFEGEGEGGGGCGASLASSPVFTSSVVS